MASFVTQTLVDDAAFNAAGWACGGGRRIVRGADGTYHVSYLTKTGADVWRLTVSGFTLAQDNSITVDYTQHVDTFSGGAIDIGWCLAIDVDGGATERLLCAYTDDTDASMRFASLDTASPAGGWTARDTFGHGMTHATYGPGSCGFQVIGRNGAGSIHILYIAHKTGAGPNSIVYHRTLATIGGTWGSASAVDASQVNTANDGWYKDLAACADTQGDLHVIWGRRADDSGESSFLRYSKYTGSWSAQTNIFWPGTPPFGVHHPVGWVDICADADDELHVICWSGVNETYSWTLYYVHWNGASWDSAEQVYTAKPSSTSYAYQPSIGVDMEGAPYVFWAGYGWGAQQLYPNPTYATKETGSWEVYPIADEADEYNLPGVPHDVWPYTDHSTTITNPLVGTIMGRLYDNDVVLYLEENWTAGHEPRAAGSLTVTMDAEGVNASVYAAAYVTLAVAVVANIPPEAAIGLTVSVDAVRAYTGSGPVSLTVGMTSSCEYLAATECVVALTVSVAAEEKREAAAAAAIGLTVSWIAHNFTVVDPIALTLTVTASSGGDFGKSAAVGLTLSVSAVGLPPEGCATDYVPDPAIPAQVDGIMLVEFFTEAGLSVTLRRPDFGDRRNLEGGDEQGRTRDGGTFLYTQPQRHSFEISWTSLTRKQALEMEDFLTTTAGAEVKYRDHNGHVWEGLVTNYPQNIETLGREQATLVIVFEGDLT